MEDDYNPVISFEGKRDDTEIIEFTLIPKPEAAVVWGKVVMAVTSKDYLPLKQDYYNEDLEVVRTMLFTEVKLLSGKQRPSVMRVVPIDKPGEYTELIYKTLQLNVPMQDDFFSLSQLKKR